MRSVSEKLIEFVDTILPVGFKKEKENSVVSWFKSGKNQLMYLEYGEGFKIKYPQVKDYAGFICKGIGPKTRSGCVYILEDGLSSVDEDRIRSLISEVCKDG